MDYSIVANIPHNFDHKTFQSWRNHNQPGPCSVLSHQEHSWSDLVRLEYKHTSTQTQPDVERIEWHEAIGGVTGQGVSTVALVGGHLSQNTSLLHFWQHTASVPKMVFNTTPSPGLLPMSCQISILITSPSSMRQKNRCCEWTSALAAVQEAV